jgi:putative hemolysin
MNALWSILILVGVVGILTGAATALRSVSRIWLRHWAERRLAGAGTATLYLDKPQRLLIAAGTGIAGTVFALGAVLGLQDGDRALALLQSLAISVVLLLVIGQLVPRALARRWPAQALPVLLPLLRVVEGLTAPLALLALRLVRRFRGPVSSQPSAYETLEDLLREGEVEGFGAAAERAIISGVVEFGTTRVRSVMTPRSEIVAVDASAPADQLALLVAQSQFSRLPVYQGSLDNIVGMLTSWDEIARPEVPIRSPRPVSVAAPEEFCQVILTRMLRERRHLAIVRGTAGETLGLVTLEDLVEEIIGDIHDEHDEPGHDVGGESATR